MASSAAKDSPVNFSFGFNNPLFSDKVLCIQLVPDSLEQRDFEGEGGQADVRVRDLHVCKLLLASKSQFFRKLFSNEMRETTESHVRVQIQESEEESFMDLMEFIYTNSLRANSANALINVLMIADRFDVDSCVQYCCSQMIDTLEMSLDLASLYLDFNHHRKFPAAAQPAIKAAQDFCVSKYQNIIECVDEVLKLHVSLFEALLASDDIRVPNEDFILSLVQIYVVHNYPSKEEGEHILQTRLWHVIRYSFLGSDILRIILKSDSLFNPNLKFRIMSRIILLQTETSFSFGGGGLMKPRAYEYLPVKAVVFESPRPHCVVYLKLKIEDCANLFTMKRVRSFDFFLTGRPFYLTARCGTDYRLNIARNFGLYLSMGDKSERCFVDVKFSARTRTTEDYEDLCRAYHLFIEGQYTWGIADIFQVSWAEFVGADSKYFIDDTLYIKAELMSMDEQPHPLIEDQQQLCVPQYQNIAKCLSKVLELPLSEFEALLGSDDILVPNEDFVLRLMIMYITKHSSSEMGRHDLVARLCHVIRFPFLALKTLRGVLKSDSRFGTKSKWEIMWQTLTFHYQTLHSPRGIGNLRQRTYIYRPVKVVVFDSPREHCVVYWKLKRKECLNLFPSNRVRSQDFDFIGPSFLTAFCGIHIHQGNTFRIFGLYLSVGKDSETCCVDFKVFMRTFPHEQFEEIHRSTSSFKGGQSTSSLNILGLLWTEVVKDDSKYFIGDNLYIMAEIKVAASPSQQQ